MQADVIYVILPISQRRGSLQYLTPQGRPSIEYLTPSDNILVLLFDSFI